MNINFVLLIKLEWADLSFPHHPPPIHNVWETAGNYTVFTIIVSSNENFNNHVSICQHASTLVTFFYYKENTCTTYDECFIKLRNKWNAEDVITVISSIQTHHYCHTLLIVIMMYLLTCFIKIPITLRSGNIITEYSIEVFTSASYAIVMVMVEVSAVNTKPFEVCGTKCACVYVLCPSKYEIARKCGHCTAVYVLMNVSYIPWYG